MTFIIDTWKIAEYPDGLNVPNFQFSSPIGPGFAELTAKRLLGAGASLEEFDFFFQEKRNNTKVFDIDKAVDSIFAACDISRDWVYLYFSDLEWGVIYSNSIISIIDVKTMNDANDDFWLSYDKRIGDLSEYYDSAFLVKWLSMCRIKTKDDSN